MSGNLFNDPHIYIYRYVYMCVCVYVYLYIIYYSVQLNWSWKYFHQDKKPFNSEHLNFPGKELNVTELQSNNLRKNKNRSH